ncbi:MAG: DUF3330 domain-containing protein [Gammaproteobacteria bacterium]|nr:DUF3330 domain-containing protein [Gammaproteobacteria bacterium]
MNAENKEANEVLLQCEVCLKEIPESTASNPEADEYVSHFCGLECYDVWREKDEKKEEG